MPPFLTFVKKTHVSLTYKYEIVYYKYIGYNDKIDNYIPKIYY